MARDTWFQIDLPVLDAAVDLFKDQPVSAEEIAEVTALDVESVGLALSRLDGSFLRVEATYGGWQYASVDEIYPDARRAVGQWPSAEVLAERILSQLTKAADHEPDPVKKSKLRALAKAAGEVGTNAVGGIIATAATYGAGSDRRGHGDGSNRSGTDHRASSSRVSLNEGLVQHGLFGLWPVPMRCHSGVFQYYGCSALSGTRQILETKPGDPYGYHPPNTATNA